MMGVFGLFADEVAALTATREVAQIFREIRIVYTARVIADLFLLGVLLYFIRKVWVLTVRIEQSEKSAEADRTITMGILKTIKGWTVVSISTEKEKSGELRRVKEAVESVPEKTATKVVEKIDNMKLPSSLGDVIHTVKDSDLPK